MSEDTPIDSSLVGTRIWHELYIEMLSNPMDRRTDRAFSEENGIHEDTLAKWKRNHRTEIFNEVQKRRKRYINELRAAAYKSIGDKIGKSLDAAKLALQLTGDFVERTENRTEIMSDADKIRRIEALRKEAIEKLEAQKQAEQGK